MSIDDRIKALQAKKDRADKIAQAKKSIEDAKKVLQSLKKKKWEPEEKDVVNVVGAVPAKRGRNGIYSLTTQIQKIFLLALTSLIT